MRIEFALLCNKFLFIIEFSSSEFVQKYYVNIKRDNPKLPILIRECSGVQPRLWTRFGDLKIDIFAYLLDFNGIIFFRVW